LLTGLLKTRTTL
jgi:cytochrome P450